MRKRISRAERRAILSKLARCGLAVAALVDGATPEEIANAIEIVEDFVVTWREALRTVEDVQP